MEMALLSGSHGVRLCKFQRLSQLSRQNHVNHYDQMRQELESTVQKSPCFSYSWSRVSKIECSNSISISIVSLLPSPCRATALSAARRLDTIDLELE